jgi:transglutaminase-like putative cysteine protease
MATRGGVDADIATGFPSEAEDVTDAPPFGELRGPLDTTVALLADHIRPFGLESPTRFEPARNPDPIRFRQMYRVSSAVMTADLMAIVDTPVGDPEWDAGVLRHYTDAPADPRYATLARRIVEEVLPEELREVPLARALALTHWLGENGIYSLRSGHAGAGDPTADFLFGDRTGYCVHFAHAAVYMMRALGLPARVATGYAVDEAARQGGSALLLTGGASHAWPEIHVEGVGWVVFDVAPQTVLDPPPPPPDADLQRLLGELARGENPFQGESLAGDVQLLDAAGQLGITISKWVGGLLGVLVLLLFLTKLWRRAAPAFAGPAALPRVVYRAELDRLSEVDLFRRRGESREAFARRVARACPTLLSLTDRHVGARFGSRRGTDRGELARLTRAVRGELRAAFPWWRRALGVLMPWSFFLSR